MNELDVEVKPRKYAIIYRSEMEFVSRCILDYPNIETGGQMFGYWMDDGTPVVLYTIGPGPHANHEVSFFNQDLRYLETVGNVLVHQYGLQHIGEWHSHHRLGLAHPSGHDAASMANGLVASGRQRFLLCIGNINGNSSRLNPFHFEKGEGTRYHESEWILKRIDSPFRELIDRELRSMLYMPKTPSANYTCYSADPILPSVKPQYAAEYWLNDKRNNLVLKAIMDFLIDDPDLKDLKLQMDANKHVRISFTYDRDFMTVISFPDRFPEEPPVFEVYTTDWTGEQYPCHVECPEWRFESDIYAAFVEYFDNTRIIE